MEEGTLMSEVPYLFQHEKLDFGQFLGGGTQKIPDFDLFWGSLLNNKNHKTVTTKGKKQKEWT